MTRLLRVSAFALIFAIIICAAGFAEASDETPQQGGSEVSLFAQETAGDQVRIALIDTGISNELGLMDSGRILEGRNYVLKNGDTHDLVGHGTYIASIIIGASGRTAGVPSASEYAVLVPLVYFSDTPEMLESGMIPLMCTAIYEAVDVYGCRVINISAGIAGDNKYLKAALDYAESRGVVVVSAVGNANENVPSALYYPAAYDTVIGVGAVDGEGVVASFSQRNESVMITANGVDIIAAAVQGGGEFVRVSGTSYSTAYVSALAADLFHTNPYLTPAQVRRILIKTATKPTGQAYDFAYGYGIINAEAALSYCVEMMNDKTLGFTDINTDAWYYSAVSEAVSHGYMNGVRVDAFSPDEPLTRAMTAAVLQRKAGGQSIPRGAVSFNDVQTNAWYSDPISWAYENGVVKGYADGSFHPAEHITREDFCVMLYRLSGESADGDFEALSFTDKRNVSDYAREAVLWATESGIITGTDKGEFLPKSDITRSQAAAMLTRG
ncbi:MAG: S-layer homology domain-containing protein [Clostridia bacterium]|nr:S-layer homology domain-containing protein [Clostridia bacterium]